MTLHHGRLGGGLLLAFLLPVIIVVHGYEKMDADSKVMRALQEAQFIEGFALPQAFDHAVAHEERVIGVLYRMSKNA